MNLLPSLLTIIVSISSSVVQQTEINFDVVLDDKKIGNIRAIEIRNGNRVIRDIKSESDAKVLAFSVHLETETKTINGEGILIEGTAYRHVNRGPQDIHATTKRLGAKKYERELNNTKSIFDNEEITFCVSDLFFNEPVHLQKIYSNMHADMLEIKSLGNGRYQTKSPDHKITYYYYQNGKLMTIESETPAGKVISKRV